MTSTKKAAALILLAATTACSAGPQSTAPLVPSVALDHSPSKGATFNFCADPPRDRPLSLTNAAWLAFFSANEYSHAHVIGPMMNQLGFVSPTVERDREWETCTGDLRELRAAQKDKKDVLHKAIGSPSMRELAMGLVPSDAPWGGCARKYFQSGDFDLYSFPAASFQRELVQRVHAGSYLEFFTGGSIDREGTTFTDDSTQAVFARSDRMILIAFRGTEPSQWSDLGADLAIVRKSLPKDGWPEGWGGVHSGFLNAFEQVEPLIMITLREDENTNTPIWITGHSLGAALATLMAARILRAEDEGLHVNFRGLYTFGSPRVGDKEFVAKLDAELSSHGADAVRFRNENDVVTAIPDTLLGFKHVGRLAYLTEGALQIRDEDDDVSYDGPSLGDHSSNGGYYHRIAGLLDGGTMRELAECPSAP
jgi:hypothetical protein